MIFVKHGAAFLSVLGLVVQLSLVPAVARQPSVPVIKAEFSSDGNYVGAPSGWRKFVVWRVLTGKVCCQLETKTNIRGFVISTNPSRIVLATGNGDCPDTLDYYDLNTGHLLASRRIYDQLVPLGHFFLQHQYYLAKGPNDHSLFIVDVFSRKKRVIELPSSLDAVTMSSEPNDSFISYACYISENAGAVAITPGLWFAKLQRQPSPGFVRLTHYLGTMWLDQIAIDTPGNEIALVALDGGWVRVWNVGSDYRIDNRPKFIQSFSNLHNAHGVMTGVSLSPNGNYVAIAYFDGLVRIYSLANKKVVAGRDFGTHNPEDRSRAHNEHGRSSLIDLVISSTEYSPDGHYLFVGTKYGKAYLWNVKKGTLERLWSTFNQLAAIYPGAFAYIDPSRCASPCSSSQHVNYTGAVAPTLTCWGHGGGPVCGGASKFCSAGHCIYPQ